jgi:hypothetical protein
MTKKTKRKSQKVNRVWIAARLASVRVKQQQQQQSEQV